MPDEARGAAIRARLGTALTTAEDVESYLQAAVDSLAEVTGLPVSSSLSTSVQGHAYTMATTSREAWQADQVEFDAAEGPCWEALQLGRLHGGIDLDEERRWPTWSAVARLLGFRSGVAVMAELRPGDRLVLNCYGEDKTLLDPAAVERAQQFVDELAATLPVALRIAQQASDVHHLQQALVNRSVIDQALGVLMAQNRCSRDEAFGILRRASQNRNVKLRDVAAAIVERLTGHPVAPPAGFNRSQD